DGENPELSKSDRHKRECYVVLEDGASRDEVENKIKTMPNYFEPNDTSVHFIRDEELERDHAKMPNGGFVITSGINGRGHDQFVEFGLKLDSNPEFRASVLVSYARAAHRLYQEGQKGAKTIYDIGPGYIHPESPADLRKKFL